MTDRELLELVAKAAGIDLWPEDVFTNGLTRKVSPNGIRCWNPLTDDGDALRLAVNLGIGLYIKPGQYTDAAYEFATVHRQNHNGDPYAATRRAIVRAAAAIGEEMK